LLAGPGHHLNADGAVSLAHDINAHTRFYAGHCGGPVIRWAVKVSLAGKPGTPSD